jgi:hypothetical protein
MELKELYQIAKAQLSETVNTENPDFRLEQAEYNEEQKEWEIVVSYLVKNNEGNIPSSFVSPFNRLYKRVRLNDKKEVLGFYIYGKSA